MNWNNKEIVMFTVSKKPLQLMYTSENLINDKEVVLKAVSNDGGALQFTLEKLQSDKDLLLLLKSHQKSMYCNSYWYEERMKILEYYKEKKWMNNNMKNIPEPIKINAKNKF